MQINYFFVFFLQYRSAEILLSLNLNEALRSGIKPDVLFSHVSILNKQLSNARGSLSLFQHHDGITGTAKDYVVDDYAKKYVYLWLYYSILIFTMFVNLCEELMR